MFHYGMYMFYYFCYYMGVPTSFENVLREYVFLSYNKVDWSTVV